VKTRGDSGRWPPVYDENDLERTIREIADGNGFYQTPFAAGWCQGDVVELEGALPVIEADGSVGVRDFATRHWLVLGNSCDLDRTIDEVTWTSAVPLLALSQLGRAVEAAKAYQTQRVFYLPAWPEGVGETFADFTLISALSRQWLNSQTPIARMRQPSWALLNACLVRYLAREDGRND
jgi:hypothetical protein